MLKLYSDPFRLVARVSAPVLAVLGGLLGAGAADAGHAPLESVERIRAVAVWSGLDAQPIALEGVVTFLDPTRNRLVLQDRTGAITLDYGDERPEVTIGQQVRFTATDAWPQLPDIPRYPQRPDRREYLKMFEAGADGKRNFFIARFRGYLHPPVSGVYHLAIASDDSSELLLGSDENPSSRRSIAKVRSITRAHDWTRTPEQRSEALVLEAGRAYYIEAVHQQAGGDTHLSVAWEGPGMPLGVIPGDCLSPALPEAGAASGAPLPAGRLRGSVLREVWDNVSVDVPDMLTAPRVLDSVLSVREPAIKARGPGAMPAPLELKPGQPLSEADRFRWCATEGTVEFLSVDGSRLQVELSDSGRRAEAIVSEWQGQAPRNLRGRRVRVEGVAEAVRSGGGALVFGRVWSRPSGSLTVSEQVPSPELCRLTTIAELTYGGATDREVAVRLSGRVVKQEEGQLVIGDGGTFVASTSPDGVTWRPVGMPIEVPMPARVYIGLAVNSRVPTGTSHAVFRHVAGFPLAPEVALVGTHGPAGRVTELENGYAVDGAGSDMWESPDQFTFVQAPLDGAGSLVAKLESFEPAAPEARAGIMIRESLAPDAQFVDLVRTREFGAPTTYMQWRWRMPGSGNRSVSEDPAPAPLPQWLKLERRFNTVAVAARGGAQFAVGDEVDVAGYASLNGGHPLVRNAVVSLKRSDAAAAGASWRPLVEIGRLNDDNRKWGGYDYFRFRGVVTFCGDVLGRHYWSVQDRSAGTLLLGREPSSLFAVPPGNFIEVISYPGWAPPADQLYADNLFRLGSAALPEPVRHPAEYLLPKRGEGTWIELEGIVRKVVEDGLLEVKTRGEVFTVAVAEPGAARLQELVDAEVRLRGVIVFPNERERLLLVQTPAQIEVTAPPPGDPFAVASEPARALTAESLLNRARHRTRLKGTVTYAEREIVYVQDETGGVRVELAAATPLAIGASVDAVGFPDWGEHNGAVLRHASVRGNSVVTEVVPLPVSLSEVAGGGFAGRLVRVRAPVVRTWETEEGAGLELEAEQRVFQVVLAGLRGGACAVPRGSLVEMTGISVKAAGALRRHPGVDSPEAVLPVRLLLRDTADFVVVRKPSWWVVQRALLVVGLAVAVAAAALVWIHRLRRRVAQRTAELNTTMARLQKEARMSATLAERDRLAGEIHDSLEQGLNGLLLQLESTANADACPPEIRSGLQLACNMATFSRTEVQYAVWELQSPLLEDSALPVAVEKIMRQIVPEQIRSTVTVEGPARRLPSGIEHHLLRVAQEALNNSVKHASARTLTVTVAYGADDVVLRVADDGCGFDPGAVRPGGLGHFGLRSLRSRVARIGAKIELESAGRGTTIQVRVRTAAP